MGGGDGEMSGGRYPSAGAKSLSGVCEWIQRASHITGVNDAGLISVPSWMLMYNSF